MSGPSRRVRILWTTTGKECLAGLPKNARRGILSKVDKMYDCTDLRRSYKPLTGPLQGYYRLSWGRYRAVFSVDEDEIANGDVLVNITVIFIVAGKREERSRGDVYQVARKLVEKGVIQIEEQKEPPE